MARKKKHEEHENHERWLISYADFITLLFAFFVVMYSVSAVNEGKFRVLSEALAAAFRSSPHSLEPIQVGKPAKSPFQPNSKIPTKAAASAIVVAPRPSLKTPKLVDLPKSKIHTGAGVGKEAKGKEAAGADADAGGVLPQTGPLPDRVAQAAMNKAVEGVMKGMAKMANDIERSMSDLIKEDMVLVRRDKHSLWLEVEIKSSILFKSGSAYLDPDAIPVLWKIANVLRGYPYTVQVEGFTDNVPIHTAEFPSNWELSAGRAASVVHLFMDAGMSPDRMVAVGYGQYRPVASNTTEAGRRKNRRVVLVVLADADARKILEIQHRQSMRRSDPQMRAGVDPDKAGIPAPGSGG